MSALFQPFLEPEALSQGEADFILSHRVQDPERFG
jgi:hypothetical protein